MIAQLSSVDGMARRTHLTAVMVGSPMRIRPYQRCQNCWYRSGLVTTTDIPALVASATTRMSSLSSHGAPPTHGYRSVTITAPMPGLLARQADAPRQTQPAQATTHVGNVVDVSEVALGGTFAPLFTYL